MSDIFPATDSPIPVDEALVEITDSLAFDDAPSDFDIAALPVDDPPPIGRGWAYDWTKKRFVRAPQGWGPMPTQGDATLREWVAKAMQTQRGAHPIHPDDYGMDDPFILIGRPPHEAAVSQYEDDLRRTLTFHPRIADVRDFQSSFDDDGTVNVSFRVVLDDDTEVAFDPFSLG